MPNYLLINYNEIPENELKEENYKIGRKMSSPIFEYYGAYDKILSMENEGSINLTNSVNFVEKKKFISSLSNKQIKKLNINPKDNDVKDKKKNNNKFNYNNSNNDIEIQNYQNNIIDAKFNVSYNNNDIQEIINNINNNFNSYYYFNSSPYNYKKNRNRKSEIKNKIRKINIGSNTRNGVWTCKYCFNLNFSFRKSCNRCNAPKE